MFSDFIKHYNIIRSVLRDVFLYGCFSREGLEDKRNISSRKISYEIRRIQQYIEEEYIRADRDGRYILYKLLWAIHKRKCVSLNYKMPESKRWSYGYEVLKPFKIRYDAQCGRFYLVSFNDKDKCVISRLDRIEDVNELKETYDAGELNKIYKAQMKYSWSSVPLGGNRPQTIKLEIRIKEPEENYLIDRIKSEAQNGMMEKVEAGVYHFTTETNDAIEMVPWLRSYTGYIKILRGGKLEKKLYYDWKEMLESYGAL